MAEPGAAGFDIRRILLLGGVVLVIVIALVLFFFRGCASVSKGAGGYTVIYSNLDIRDAANVIARLKELKIPYKIGNNGEAIAVPKEVADDARMGLAEKNLPAGGVVGWEIFDESKLGATDFDRRIQLIRAISGEISRTIRKIQAVDDARVQIVLPETRLFAELVAPVTASVMLRIKPGAELSQEKINGIVHLVASSVENLQTENVTVIDSTGRILTSQDKKRPSQMTEEETTLASEKINAGLVELAEAKVVSPEVAPTPETMVVIKEETLEVSSNVTNQAMFLVQAKKELELDLSGKAQEILNRFYPPNSAIIKVNLEPLSKVANKRLDKDQLIIKKATAIILIDNRVDLTSKLKSATFKVVAAAIGYNKKRGDRIVMQKVPFHLATPPPEIVKGEVDKVLLPPIATTNTQRRSLSIWPWLLKMNIWFVIALLALAVIIVFGLRRGTKNEAGNDLEFSANVPERKPAPAAMPKNPALEKIRAAAEHSPEQVAEMLKKWLAE